MRRLIFSLIFLIFLAGFVGGLYLWTTRVSSLERALSTRLGGVVVIEDVRIGWGRLTIEGLRLKNPADAALPYAFQGGALTLEMSPLALLKNTIYVDYVKIENPVIGVQLYNSSGSDNNWVRLLGGFPSGGEQRFVIRKLVITHLRFDVVRANGKILSVPEVPVLEFENLGERGALPLSQIARIVFQTILGQLSERAHLGAILERARVLPQGLLDGVKLPVEDVRKGTDEGFEKIKRKTKEASEFLQDLFSRK